MDRPKNHEMRETNEKYLAYPRSSMYTLHSAGHILRIFNNTHMASAGARAYNGGLGTEPQRGSLGRAPCDGQEGKAFL